MKGGLLNTPVRTAALTDDQNNTDTCVTLLDQSVQSKHQRCHPSPRRPGIVSSSKRRAPIRTDLVPIDVALQAVSQLPALTASPVVQSWTAADPALGTSTVINHTLTLDFQSGGSTRCENLQPSSRDPQEEGTTPEAASNLIKLSPQPRLESTCYPIIMIHLSSVHCDGCCPIKSTQGLHQTKRGNCKD